MPGVSSKKSKFYKNPKRNKPDTNVGHYTPEYKKLDISPEVISAGAIANNIKILEKDPENPRTRQPSFQQQPYAEPVNNFTNIIPNVGNNMEHTWSGVDEEIVDDLDIDPNEKMIDNNEVINYEDIEVKSDNFSIDGLESVLDLKEGQYILFVQDMVIDVGDKDKIINIATSLIFGEHEICEGNEVPIDNISVLKKVPVKVGLFLE